MSTEPDPEQYRTEDSPVLEPQIQPREIGGPLVRTCDACPAPVHGALIRTNGELFDSARRLPEIREFIESRPKTTATFRLSYDHAPDLNPKTIPNAMMEFLGTWKLPGVYDVQSSNTSTVYVNPHSAHAHTFPDVYVYCQCGAVIASDLFNDRTNPLENEHDHADDCIEYHSHLARARLWKLRELMLRRLAQLGWTRETMTPRFGYAKRVTQCIQRLSIDLELDYDTYYRLAANTYAWLTTEQGEDPGVIADIYGCNRKSFPRWAKKYGDYTYEHDGRDGDWVYDPEGE